MSFAEWIGRAPAPGYLRTLLAIFVAAAVGAVSAVAVVLSLLSALTAEPQSGVMLPKKTVEAANSGVRQEEPQPTPRPVTPSADSAGAPAANDQPLTPSQTISGGAITSTSNGVEQEVQMQFDRRQPNFVVHHRRVYSRRFANTFLNLPLPRRW
jgi:hypothetical protein